MDKPPDQQITKFINGIFTSPDDKAQHRFLRSWPAFKFPEKLISLWIVCYKELHEQQSLRGSSKLASIGSITTGSLRMRGGVDIKSGLIPESEISKKKNRMVNFLIIGLAHKLLDAGSRDISRIIELMVGNKEKSEFINIIKLQTDKFQVEPVTGRKSVSARSVSEISHLPLAKREDSQISVRARMDPKYKNIMDIAPRDLALYITYCFADIIKSVSVHDILGLVLNGGKMDHKKWPHLSKLASEFNKLSYIIPTQVLMRCKDRKTRTKFLKYILQVADELMSLGNYHAIYAVTAGLNMNQIQRLPKLWKEGSTIMTGLAKLDAFITPLRNYREYREALRQIGKKPCIPYVGVMITDLTFLAETSLILNGEVNEKSYEILGNVLELYDTLNKCYIIPVDEEVKMFMSNMVICTNEDILRDLSNSERPEKNKELVEVQVRRGSQTATYEVGFNRPISLEATDGKDVSTTIVITPRRAGTAEVPAKTQSSKHLSLRVMPRQNSGDIGGKPKSSSLGIRPIKDDNYDSIRSVCVEAWENKHVIIWLRHIRMQEYSDAFVRESIKGSTLRDLTEAHLKNDLHVDKLGHRIEILQRIKALNSLHNPISKLEKKEIPRRKSSAPNTSGDGSRV